MHDDERARIADGGQTDDGESIEQLSDPGEDSAVCLHLPLASEGEAEGSGERRVQQQSALSERQLWRSMAAQRGATAAPRGWLACAQPAERRKLHQRIRLLIGRLPVESLEEFSGLVAFTETFLARAQFVCDLVVYLFAEREKGLQREGTEGRRYVEFLTGKLMWELDVANHIAEQQPLSRLNEEYEGWLADRILDGEVLI